MSSLHLLGVLRFACRGKNFFLIAMLVHLTTDLMKVAYVLWHRNHNELINTSG